MADTWLILFPTSRSPYQATQLCIHKYISTLALTIIAGFLGETPSSRLLFLDHGHMVLLWIIFPLRSKNDIPLSYSRQGEFTNNTCKYIYIHHEAAAHQHMTELVLMPKLGTCRCMVSRRHQNLKKVPCKMEYRGDQYRLDWLGREYIN